MHYSSNSDFQGCMKCEDGYTPKSTKQPYKGCLRCPFGNPVQDGNGKILKI